MERNLFLRMKENSESISIIFENWPRYKDPVGCELIDIDFAWLFPNRINNLFTFIDQFESDMCTSIFPLHIKDKLNLHLFDKMRSLDLQKDTRHFYFFNLLHAVILPPRISTTCKPSISDAQHDMIVHLANINNMQQKLDELFNIAVQAKQRVQLKIIAVGNTVENLKEFYVYLDGFKYKVPTLIRAIDVIIKSCFVFNLKYSAKSKYVWMLLQEYIYKISSKEKIPKIQTIINKLKK